MSAHPADNSYLELGPVRVAVPRLAGSHGRSAGCDQARAIGVRNADANATGNLSRDTTPACDPQQMVVVIRRLSRHVRKRRGACCSGRLFS